MILDHPDKPGDDVIFLPGDDVIFLPGDDAIFLPGDDAIFLPGDDATFLPGDDATFLPGDDGTFLPGDDGTFGLMECGGSWCLERGNEKAYVAAGQVALLNPGQDHSGIPGGSQSVTYRMLYIDMHRMAEMAGDIGRDWRGLGKLNRIQADKTFRLTTTAKISL